MPGAFVHAPAQILTCINAVRYDPFVMADVPCFSVVQTPATNLRRPQRWNLTINNALIDAAISHNGLQIEKEQIITNSMRISLGLPDLPNLVRAAGYNPASVTFNLASGQASARAVVASWFCSTGSRNNMFSCLFEEVGIASGSEFITMMFGCVGLKGSQKNGAVFVLAPCKGGDDQSFLIGAS
ncbi:hypothetical protein GPECTOR_5g240 [Gonium pectorale]|uniref:Uncharacterized protein n=1 Tax=Gonium pectorale TaxID=33097 RepID=A0A150GWA8_GONPE|nr:hypothetical protein GPECTOR_5g240 [Gonium pectorale]|eukprot:KXZ54141.1 hypothetical protein GPECTOR_5g240 [Gonium pectorale]